MIAIDTNVIVRFLTQDDEVQYKKACRLFNREELFIPDTVILETEWVLRFAYGFSPSEIVEAFRKLFGIANVHVENGLKVARVIAEHWQGLDFADSFHLANSEQLSELVTFDERFVKQAKGLSSCRVRKA
ncbi:MAG: type II toxin-antitoxin system VapC family toxin [Gammaproteobacteria bacterium]